MFPGWRRRRFAATLGAVALAFGIIAGPGRAEDHLGRRTAQVEAQAEALFKLGRYSDALPLAARAVEEAERHHAAGDRAVAGPLLTLSRILGALGRNSEAEALERRALAIDEQAFGPDAPNTAAALMALGDTLAETSRPSEAEALLKRSFAIRAATLGPEHPDSAKTLCSLGAVYRIQDHVAEADDALQRCLAIAEKKLGTEDPAVATALDELGSLYRDQGRFAEAERIIRRSVAIREKKLGARHPETIFALDDLALLYDNMGQQAEAEALYKRLLGLKEKVLGPEHPSTAATLNNLGGLYTAMENYAAAEPVLKRALAINEKLSGPGLDRNLYSLAYLYTLQDRLSEGETLYKRAIAIREQRLGPDNTWVGQCLNGLAYLYDRQSRYAEAEALYKRALAIVEKSMGPDHLNAAIAQQNLGRLYVHEARYAEAIPLYQHALATYDKVAGAKHPTTTQIRDDLANLYETLGRHAEAEELKASATASPEEPRVDRSKTATPDELQDVEREITRLNNEGKYAEATGISQRTFDSFEKKFGANDPRIAKPLMNLAHAYYKEKRIADAEKLYLRAIEIVRNALGPDHPQTAAAILQLSRFYSAQRRYAEAEPLYRQLFGIDERVHGKDHPDTLASAGHLAQLYTEMGRYDEAAAIYKDVWAAEERVRGADDVETLNTKGLLASEYEYMGRYDEAEALELQILETKERILGTDHPKTLNTVEILAGLYDEMGRPGEAERLYKRGLEGRERRIGRSDFETLKAALNLGSLYLHYGRYDEAAELFRRVVDSSDRVLKQSDLRFIARMNLAVAYLNQGRFADAESLLKDALDLADKWRGGEHPDKTHLMVNLAAAYRGQKQYDKAEQLLQQVADAGGSDSAVREALNSLAVMELETARPGSGPDRAARARELLLRILQMEEREHTSNPITLNNIGLTYLSEGDWANAVAFLRRATAASIAAEQRIAEGIGKVATGPAETQTRHHRSEFINLVKALFRFPQEEGASKETIPIEMFQAAQRIIDGDAAASLAKMAMRGASGDPALAAKVRERQDLIAEWQELDAAHNKALALPPEKRNAAAEAAIAEKLTSIDRRIAGLDDRLAVEFPQFTALAGQVPLSVEEVQADLKPDEALVLFFDTPQSAAPEETFIWVVTKTDMHLAQSASGTPTLTAAVTALRCGLDRAGNWAWVKAEHRWRATNDICRALRPDGLAPDDDLPFDTTLAHNLYDALFFGRIENWIRGKRLIIVPSGPLTQLPFHVLVTDIPKDVPSGLQKRRIAKLGAELANVSDEDRRRLQWNEPGGVRIVKVEKGTAAEKVGLKADDILIAVGEERVTTTPNAIQTIRGHAPGSGVELSVFRSGSKLAVDVVLGAATLDEWQALYWTAKNAAQIHWLAQDHAITVLPAVSSLKALRELAKQSHASEAYIGFGNPLLSGEPDKYPEDAAAAAEAQAARCPPETPQPVALASGRGGVRAMKVSQGPVANTERIRMQQPLPETAQELCEVAGKLGVDPASHLYLGARASEAEVKRLSDEGTLAKYKIVHFATHGFVAGQLSAASEPGLILTPPDTASEGDDGYLAASEIAALKLDADWVILSACNTAAGGTGDADALSGLARAFFYAGARSLLVSHWAVNSRAAVELVTRTASELKDDARIGRAEALRRAMLSMINAGDEREAHPAFWAPFVLVGEGAATVH